MMPGPTELALLLVIVLIVFGAGRLRQVFEALGEGVKKFREAQREEDPEEVAAREKAKPMLSGEARASEARSVAEAEEIKEKSA